MPGPMNRFVQRVFLLIAGTLYDLIRLHSLRGLPPLLAVPPLGHKYLCMSSSTFAAIGSLLLCRLIHRWDITIATSSAVAAVGEFSPLPPDPPLGHISLVQPHPLSQPLGVSSSSACSTVGLYKSRPCRFSVGASWHPITPAATRRHCRGLVVERLFAGRERLTLWSPVRGAARSLLASGDGWKRKVTSSQTHTLRIDSYLAGTLSVNMH